MSTTSRIAAGVTAGYLLGRHKKLKLAIIVGSAIANKRIVGSGLSSGLNKLQEASGGGGVGGKLLDAGKGAALATVSHRIDAVSLDDGGTVTGYRRLHRYTRAQTEEG